MTPGQRHMIEGQGTALVERVWSPQLGQVTEGSSQTVSQTPRKEARKSPLAQPEVAVGSSVALQGSEPGLGSQACAELAGLGVRDVETGGGACPRHMGVSARLAGTCWELCSPSHFPAQKCHRVSGPGSEDLLQMQILSTWLQMSSTQAQPVLGKGRVAEGRRGEVGCSPHTCSLLMYFAEAPALPAACLPLAGPRPPCCRCSELRAPWG